VCWERDAEEDRNGEQKKVGPREKKRQVNGPIAMGEVSLSSNGEGESKRRGNSLRTYRVRTTGEAPEGRKA